MHPAQVLLADFIEPMGITRYRVAKAIGVQQRRIDEICAGERAITAETAVRLGLAFDIEPQFWLNLQAQYDLEVASAPYAADRLRWYDRRYQRVDITRERMQREASRASELASQYICGGVTRAPGSSASG